MEIESLYSNELKRLLNFMTTKLIEDNPSPVVGVDYFFLSVLENTDSFAYKMLNSYLSSLIIDTIHNSFYELIHSKSLTAMKPNREIKFSDELNKFLSLANTERLDLNDNTITSEHVVLSFLNENNDENYVRKVLAPTSLTYDIFKKNIIQYRKDINPIRDDNNTSSFFETNKTYEPSIVSTGQSAKLMAKKTNILSYCVNLNEQAEKGKIDKLVGRDQEIKQIIKILGRRKKNNAILVGESGVGKSAICEGLAYRIQEGNVPSFLLKKKMVSLDITSMLAGTQFRGMFEERMKGLIDELKSNGDYILFIDDIHSVLSEKFRSDIDITSMLNNALTDGDIQIIGTTSFKEFRNTFENNSNLSRKFQKIVINPLTTEETYNILQNIKQYYERYHGVVYTDDALKACANLANKYMTDRNLPDSAIDLLDESGSAASVNINEPETIKSTRKKLSQLKKDKFVAINNDDYEKVDLIASQEKKLKVELSEAETELKKNNRSQIKIDSNEINIIISEKTGIPITKLTNDEKNKLANIDKILKKFVIGQDDAIDRICKVIKRNRIGLSPKNKTMANIFILGTTGCGKTLVAKKLAKEVFGDEKYLVRFDMSEYSDKTSINKLIGSNPGYVGYDNGGQLTEIIKNKKHCVLLLDEIEKSDPQIFNLFLQVFDEGYLTDNAGMKVDFKNVIIILTSNVGAKEANEFGNGIGLIPDSATKKKDIMEKELKKKFSPEFINRLDDIIYFNILTDDNLKKIINIELSNLNDRLKNLNYNLSYNDDIIDYLFNIINKDKEYGARPIIRAIQDEIENKLTDLLLTNDYEKNYTFKIEINDNQTELIIS